MNSRLNVSLRERKGLVYSVESNLTSYTDTGIFCIYFGTDPNDVDRCLTLTYKELKKLCDLKLTPSQLAAAKKQLIGQIGWPPIITRITLWEWLRPSFIITDTKHPRPFINE